VIQEYFKNKPRGKRHSNPEFAAMSKDLDPCIGFVLLQNASQPLQLG